MSLAASEILISTEASAALRALATSPNPASRSIARRVDSLRAVLRSNCLHGEVVKRDRIPRALRHRYGIDNLYVEDLPAFWRLLYTVGRRDSTRYVIIVAVVDHPTYSAWFRHGPR